MQHANILLKCDILNSVLIKIKFILFQFVFSLSSFLSDRSSKLFANNITKCQRPLLGICIQYSTKKIKVCIAFYLFLNLKYLTQNRYEQCPKCF